MLSKNEIKLIKSLNNKKFRKQHNLFIAEGERLVKEAITNKGDVEQVFLADSINDKNHLIDIISQRGIPSKIISDNQMRAISGTVTPSGFLAICKIAEPKPVESIGEENILYLDTIQDPGNLGTLLRSAAWFGIKNVVLSENCIDPYNPKVIRSGMGAHFNLDILIDIPLNIFNRQVKIGGFQEGKSIYSIDKKQLNLWVLVIGNEAGGIRPTYKELIDYKVTIPKIGQGESLNAAVAASVLLYQLTAPL